MRRAAWPLLLAATVLAVYWPVRGFELINFDDDLYVAKNPLLQGGLSPAALAAAFTDLRTGLWIPLTWISFLLESAAHGLDPGALHLTNAILHALAAATLCLVLARMTGRAFESFVAAGLFALHPLHVESVAWVSERKDVLSALFAFVSLGAWLGHARTRSPGRYLLSLACFALSLLAKPTLVTLPALLLLLDFWPLGRLRDPDRAAAVRLLVEKLPFLALALAVATVTVAAQASARALAPADALPFATRAAHAVVSYAAYAGTALWPAGLAILYPHPEAPPPPWQLALAFAAVALATLAAAVSWRRRPFLAAGWAWYLVALLPVAGLLQSGYHLRADRFTYLPLVGPFLALAFAISPGAGRGAWQRGLATLAGLALLAACAALSRSQLWHWRDSYTVFTRAAAVTEGNYLAHSNLAHWLLLNGRVDEALAHAGRAVAINPAFALAQNNLGVALSWKGRAAEAVPHYREAVRLDPGYTNARRNLEAALRELGGGR